MMKKEKAEKILGLVQAIIDGKQIQRLNGDKDNQWWSDDDYPDFNLPDLLRVKPDPLVFYINVYSGSSSAAYESAEKAKNNVGSSALRTAVKCVEVFE